MCYTLHRPHRRGGGHAHEGGSGELGGTAHWAHLARPAVASCSPPDPVLSPTTSRRSYGRCFLGHGSTSPGCRCATASASRICGTRPSPPCYVSRSTVRPTPRTSAPAITTAGRQS